MARSTARRVLQPSDLQVPNRSLPEFFEKVLRFLCLSGTPWAAQKSARAAPFDGQRMGEVGWFCFASGIQPGPVEKVLESQRFCPDVDIRTKPKEFKGFWMIQQKPWWALQKQ